MAENIEYLNEQIEKAQPAHWYDDWGNMTCSTLNGGIPFDEWPVGFATGMLNTSLPTGKATGMVCRFLND